MPNNTFQFKKFRIKQDEDLMKVGTDGIILGSWVDCRKAKLILDIGTGTGLIALMMAQKSITAHIEAVEIDKAASDLARENFKNSSWLNRMKIENISFQKYVAGCLKKYDLIISNPPFFRSSLLSAEKLRNQSRHQTDLTYDELIKGVVKLLDQKGKFCMIAPFDQEEVIVKECKNNGLHLNRLLKIKPTPVKEYFRIILEFQWEKKETKESELTIMYNNSCYTNEFKLLTKDFYL